MKKLFIVLFLLFSQLLFARTTRTANTSGSWGTSTNWSPASIPDSAPTNGNDDIIINSDITLTGNLDVKANTTILVKGCFTLHVTGNVIFNNGCVFVVDSCAVLIIDGNVQNNNNSNQISINGNISIGGNYDGGNGSAVIGTGSMTVSGYVNTDGSGTVFTSDDDCNIPGTCSSSSTQPLPIKLKDFTVYNESNTNKLNWITSTEINNDYFTIEISIDCFKWKSIGIINGSGNSNIEQSYIFNDNTYGKNINYYRLKQTDFDGQFTYSKTISINNNSNSNYILRTYNKHIYLTDVYNYELYDMIGNLVRIGNSDIVNGNDITCGVYILKIDEFVQKIIFKY